jgi:hypothetical protein
MKIGAEAWRDAAYTHAGGWNGNCEAIRIDCIRTSAMPRKSSRARARSRRLGILGLLLSAALTPAGIMVGTVTAGALVGGLAFHLKRAAPAAQPIPTQSGSPQLLTLEHGGKVLSIVLTEDRLAGDGSTNSFDLPPGPLLAGLGGSGPSPHAIPGGMPPHASPGAPAPAGKPSLAGPAPAFPPATGPNGARPGVGPSHVGSPSTGTPPGPAATPPHAGPPRPPAGDGAPAHPPGEAGAPASPQETPQPPHGAPEGTLPPSPPDAPPDALTPPQTGEVFRPLNSLDPLVPPPNQKLAAQQPAAVPEPSLLGLMLLGLAAMAWAGRRRAVPVRLA